MKNKEQCEVCGARVKGFRKGTCDRICARAARSHCTRWDQIKLDILYAEEQDRQRNQLREFTRLARLGLEDLFYNQQYLVYA